MFRDKKNKLILMNLFWDLSTNPNQVLYTLQRQDAEGYPSLYQAFMEMEDFMEFNFANKYFESFQHWKKICQHEDFMEHIGEWREELELKVKSRSLQSLIGKAETDANVAKYLLGNKWVETATEANPTTNLRGRPTKQEIRNHLTLITSQEKQIDEDYKRIKA